MRRGGGLVEVAEVSPPVGGGLLQESMQLLMVGKEMPCLTSSKCPKHDTHPTEVFHPTNKWWTCPPTPSSTPPR